MDLTLDAREQDRLAALRAYRILDTDPEQAFDDLALLASQICGTPVALITLVDAERQWFKARVGITARETARSIAFCSRAIEQPELFIVRDATKDERFRDNPLVLGEPHIRFYAGAPLLTPEGHALGTLCVVDGTPRQLSRRQQDALLALKRQVEAQLELRRSLLELRTVLAARDAAEEQQAKLVEELREALAHVRKLDELMPICSACRLNMVIPADPRAIATVTDGVMKVVRGMQCVEGHELEVELSLREALANAIRHGCQNDASKQIQCCVTCDDSGEIVIVVRDPGPGFDPASIPSPLEEDNLLRSHGRGIHLINEFMDEVNFAREGREIHMRKRPAGPSSRERP
jgi:anti-sigma regulatory factor (Ser/Thr protein kinase)